MAKKPPETEMTTDEILSDEKKRLGTMEKMATLILNNAATIDKETKMVTGVEMTSAEMKSYIGLNEDLMRLRRKIYGLLDW